MVTEKFYLVGNEDGTWVPMVSKSIPVEGAVEFVAEGDYPVQLWYRRTDLNGSDVIEMEVCSDREEVLETLSFIGDCGFVPLNLWNFDSKNEMSVELFKIFKDGVGARHEFMKKELDDFIAAAESEKECVSQDSFKKREIDSSLPF